MTILTILLTTTINGYQISGTIYEDINGDSNISNDGVKIEGVKIYLYRDNGDGKLNGEDTFIGSTQTDSDGKYTFTPSTTGDYFVIVDSKTLTPSAGLKTGYTNSDVWAEQSYGSAGVYCDTDGDSSTPPEQLDSAGSCFGGAYGNQSDNFSTLLPSGAEHYGKVSITDSEPEKSLDFGFSFNLVVNVEDLIDDTGDPAQGSLRQFILNSNRIEGANQMRFVPAVPPNISQNGGKWWQIIVDKSYDSTKHYSLPPVEDSNTTLNGTAYSYTDGISNRDTNPGSSGGSGKKVGVGADGRPDSGDEIKLPVFNKKELELNLSEKGDGIVFKEDGGKLEEFAIFNGENRDGSILVKIEGDNVSISNNFIGVRADGTQPSKVNSKIGIDLYPAYSQGLIEGNLIGYLGDTGVRIEGKGRVTLNDIFQNGLVEECGNGISAQIVNGNSTNRNRDEVVIDGNRVWKNAGFGILSDPAGAFTLSNSSIYQNGIGDKDGNRCNNRDLGGVLVKGNGNLLQYNRIYQNRGAGIVVAKGNSQSVENKISRNSFYENGGIGIDLDNSGETGDGVTANDGKKDSSQQNKGVDYPIIQYGEKEGDILRVKGYVGTYNSPIAETFTLQFYRAKDDGNNNGEGEEGDGKSLSHGEGEMFLAQCDSKSDGTFECNLTLNGATLGDGEKITAIAIDSNSNTSEFGPNRQVVIVPTVYGYVYNDKNHNFLKGEGEEGLAGISVKLWYKNGNDWVLENSITTDSNGYFTFHPQKNGTYRIVEDAQNSATSSAQSSDKPGWISTNGNIYETPWEKTKEILVFFGDYHGGRIDGTIFNDNGGGEKDSSTANNGVQDGEERGIEEVIVKACQTTSCNSPIATTLTKGEGNYSLYVPADYDGKSIYVIEEDPTGWTSTGDNRNGTIDSDATTSLLDRNSLKLEFKTGQIYTGYNFADVGVITLNHPQGESSTQGGTITLRHTLFIKTPGKIALLLASETGVVYSLWEDSDCDGIGEQEISPDDNGYYWLKGGEKLGVGEYCFILKGFTPTDLEPNWIEKLTILAFEDWNNASNPNGETGNNFDDIGEVVDSFPISVAGGKLRLIKQVRNLTTGEEFGVKNSGKPGDRIEYRIGFKNLGGQPLKKVALHDAIPRDTRFITGNYNGDDVKLTLNGEEFTGKIGENPDQDGVTLINGVLNVDLSKLTNGKYSTILGGDSGYLYYQVQLKK